MMDACAEQAAKQSAAQHFTRVAKRLVLVVIFIPLPCFAVFLQLETDNIRHTPHSASAWVGTQSCNDIPMMGLTLRERDSVSGIGAQPQRSRGVHSVHRKPELESLSFGQCCRKSARSPCVAPVSRFMRTSWNISSKGGFLCRAAWRHWLGDSHCACR